MSDVDFVEVIILVDDYSGYEVRGLVGQHGISVLMKAVVDGEVSKVIFDVGQDFRVIKYNVRLLNENLNDVGVVVLSHRHYDHTGGLLGLLKHIKHTVPIVAHPDITKPNIYIGDGQVKLLIGLPFNISEVDKYGGQLLLTKSVLEVAPGIYFLGEIPRVISFEGVPKGFYTLDEGELVRDELRDDTALAVKVRGLGLVVISGCSHSGIVNIVRYTAEVLKDKPYAVIGGLHLIDADEERIKKTIDGLKKLGVKEVYVGHCTGLRAEYEFLRAYRDKFKKIHSGFRTRFYVKSDQ